MADTNMSKLAEQVAWLDGNELAEHPGVRELSPPDQTQLRDAIADFHRHRVGHVLKAHQD